MPKDHTGYIFVCLDESGSNWQSDVGGFFFLSLTTTNDELRHQ